MTNPPLFQQQVGPTDEESNSVMKSEPFDVEIIQARSRYRPRMAWPLAACSVLEQCGKSSSYRAARRREFFLDP